MELGQETWIRVAMQDMFCCRRGYMIFIVTKLSNQKIIHQGVDQKRGWGLQISPGGFCCRSQMLSDDALAFVWWKLMIF